MPNVPAYGNGIAPMRGDRVIPRTVLVAEVEASAAAPTLG
jgi:hypothetical protein